MLYVGLDVHKSQTSMCALDAGGNVILQKTMAGDWRAVQREVGRFEEPVSVCFEASGGAGFLRDRLLEVADRVVVVNPAQVHVIWKSKRKNDRADAAWLAKLLILDMAPEVHVPDADVRSWRQMIEYRRRLLRRRTGIKNAIRSHLRAHGKRAGGGLWTRAGLAWLAAESFASTLAAVRRDLLQEELAEADANLRRATRALDAIAKGHPVVQRLMTIPGVGPRTAEAVVAYVDRAERFARTKRIGSYFGLVPTQDQSGSRNLLGHITRRGPSVVRWLLTEAAWQGIRKSPTMRRFYDGVLKGDPDRRKVAAVATAHYLARVMLAMMKTGQAWREAA